MSLSTSTSTTLRRHPLASKRYMLVFSVDGDETMEMFELLSRYEAVAPIGKGTYGYVCSARDNDRVDAFAVQPPAEYADAALSEDERSAVYDAHTLVAVKKLRQLFANNQPRMWLCAAREIQLIMAFRHDNVMTALDFFIPIGGAELMTYESVYTLRTSFDSVYIVMKKYDYTLREVLDSVTITAADVAAYEQEQQQQQEEQQQQEQGEQHDEQQQVAVTATTRPCNGDAHDGNVDTTSAASSLRSHDDNENDDNTSGSNHDSAAAAATTPLRCPLTGLLLHPLSRDYRKFVLYQIFRGVGYMHLCHVIHRDLKPENIMLDTSYGTCVTDFGQGRDVGGDDARYAETWLDNCTQWYAAPETLSLSLTAVGFVDNDSFHGLDVWSIGCIAAEMLIGRPLFYTTQLGGLAQLRTIADVLGSPTEADMASIAKQREKQNSELFVRMMRKLATYAMTQRPAQASGTSTTTTQQQQPPAAAATAPPLSPRTTLAQLLTSPYHDEDDDEVALITRCLAWDPHARLTIPQALASDYFAKDGYSAVIDPDHTATRVLSVRQEHVSDQASGRAFLWDLFVRRHPEMVELQSTLKQRSSSSGSIVAVSPSATSTPTTTTTTMTAAAAAHSAATTQPPTP